MRDKNALIGIGIVVFSVLILAGALGVRYSALQKEKPIPGFTKILLGDTGDVFTDLSGAPVSLKSFEGAPVVLFAWASWCPSCGEQLTLISRVISEEGITTPVIAINRGETLELAQDYLAFIQKPNNMTYFIDKKDLFFKTAEGYAMPEFIVYNSKGEEVFHQRGTITEEEIRTAFATVPTR